MNKSINLWLNPAHEKIMNQMANRYFLKSRSAFVSALIAHEKNTNFQHLRDIISNPLIKYKTHELVYSSVYLGFEDYDLVKSISSSHNISMSFFLSNLVYFYVENTAVFNPVNIYQ